jgi:hypothetical protein
MPLDSDVIHQIYFRILGQGHIMDGLGLPLTWVDPFKFVAWGFNPSVLRIKVTSYSSQHQ